MYRVNLSAGKQYTFKSGCGDGATASFDTLIDGFQPNCSSTNPPSNDDGCESNRSKLTFTATSSGYHYVKVRGYLGASGSFTLKYREEFICVPPGITSHPSPATICQDQSNQFCVSASGTAPLSYKWQRDAVDIPTSATLSCYTATLAGSYRCVVSNSCGSATSNSATLTVNSPPSIPSDPTPPDGATEVPLDTNLCWNTAAKIAKVIYGVDDRLDVYQVSNPATLAAADSTVALVGDSDLTDNGNGTYTLPSQSFTNRILNTYGFPLCADERFRVQPVPAFCSGFLVGPDLIATAGHCIIDTAACAASAFVFGFDMVNASTPVLTFAAADVYWCDSIVGRVQTDTGADWAVIRVDRPVVGHVPLPIRCTGTIANGRSLLLIGHPVGLPTKVAGGATVRDNGPSTHFQANVDSYGGNSGSAVFDTTTPLTVEGVLVRGREDFVLDGNCIRSNVCPDSGCPGWEAATRTTEFAHLVPECRGDEYDVYFGPCGNLQFRETITSTCWNPPTPSRNTRYCWRVVARNDCGETSGPIWSFTTADCFSDPDCDDGVFCNGQETCVDGSCVPGTNPCQASCTSPGTNDGDCAGCCNEALGNCTAPEPNGSPCDDGLFCNGSDTCIGGSCNEHTGDPCTPNTCDEPTRTCIPLRELLSCSPEHCNIDARIAHDRLDQNIKKNANTIVMTFSNPTTGMTAADFEITLVRSSTIPPPDPPDTIPGISAVTPSGNDATIVLNRRIQQTRWTCIRDKGSNKWCCFGSLPGDADTNQISKEDDVSKVLHNLQGVVSPVLAIEKCDTDRSTKCVPADLLMVVDLLNGADAFIEVNGDTLPRCPSIVP